MGKPKVTMENVYSRLKSIQAQADNVAENSFSKTRVNAIYRAGVLGILDDLEYLEEKFRLLDDSDLEGLDEEDDEDEPYNPYTDMVGMP